MNKPNAQSAHAHLGASIFASGEYLQESIVHTIINTNGPQFHHTYHINISVVTTLINKPVIVIRLGANHIGT